jgi:hypothetical protein
MPRRSLAGRCFAVLVALVSVACSNESPIAPATPDGGASPGLAVRGVAGSYQLSFLMSGSELVLKAHVQEAISGAPAQGGTATFQICSRKGGPTLQMAPLPSVECRSGGSGSWVRLARMPVNASGDAFVNFGVAPAFTTVGFRFLYDGLRGGIASGESAPVDFVP